MTNWALDHLSRSYLNQNYDVTKYWTLAAVRKVSNDALQRTYRYYVMPLLRARAYVLCSLVVSNFNLSNLIQKLPEAFPKFETNGVCVKKVIFKCQLIKELSPTAFLYIPTCIRRLCQASFTETRFVQTLPNAKG